MIRSVVGMFVVVSFAGCATEPTPKVSEGTTEAHTATVEPKKAPLMGEQSPSMPEGYAIVWKAFSSIVNVNLVRDEVTYSINITGTAEYPPDARVIATAYTTEISECTDEQGMPLLAGEPAGPEIIRAFSAGGNQKAGPEIRFNYTNNFRASSRPAVNIQLSNLARMPKRISSLRGSYSVQVAKTVETREIPFGTSGAFVELYPELSVALETRSRGKSGDTENIAIKLTWRKPSTPANQMNRENVSVPVILAMEVFDDGGREIGSANENRNVFNPNRDHVEGYYDCTIQLQPERKPAKIRISVMTEVETVTIPILVRDLPVP